VTPGVGLAPHHLALRVDDLPRMEHWYRAVLGLPVVQRWPAEGGGDRAVWLGLGEETFLALERAKPGGRTGQVSDTGRGWAVVALGIAASEREAWRARLANHGVSITGSTQWTLYFADPEGNRLALSHHPETDPGGSKPTTSG